MDDVWFGLDTTQADFEACSRALPSNDGPLLAIREDEKPPRLVFASRAFFRLFGVKTGEALAAALLDATEPSRLFEAIAGRLRLDGAPRLERVRFYTNGGAETVTFQCRLVGREGAVYLVAAAVLGLRDHRPTTAIAADPREPRLASNDETGGRNPLRHDERTIPAVSAAMNVQTIQSMLRTRWQTSRTPRFTWQTDPSMVCTHVTSMLADLVGETNADIVGRDMMDLAALIDPTGRLAAALARKQTWSGLQINWPLTDTPAAIAVDLGAIPIFDRDDVFEGYRGYGVVHLDQVTARDPLRLSPKRPDGETSATANVVRLRRGTTALSEEDRKTFVVLGEELREEAGLPAFDAVPAEDVGGDRKADAMESDAVASPIDSADRRIRDVTRHGAAILDRIAFGIIVSRDNVPIFANRHALETLGFENEDAFHAAGGMAYLFDRRDDETLGKDLVRIKDRRGRIVESRARMQTIDWDGLPATLLTLLPATDKAESPDHGDETEIRELRAILETATDGVAVIDTDCNILSLNRSGEALFGCDRGEVIGRPFLSLFAPHNQGLASDYLEGLKSSATQQLLNDGREILVKAHRGETIPVFMTLGRLSGGARPNEVPSGARFCALFRDLTHWKKVEQDLESAKEQAERANDLKTDFLAKVSHEVRTPLNAIIGFAEVMMDERFGPVGNERYKDYLRDIHTSGTHVMSLVNDLLDLSKIEAGKMDLAVEIIDVNHVIGECVAIMQPQASVARVIMRLSLAPTLPRIKADERSVRQIALNVLSNAVKFNDPGGQVIVATAITEAGHVVIRIRDTGPGMSESDLAAALEPFRQLPTARAIVGGTGLGLPLTKALVEANQAAFSIRSKLGHGTLVEVAFPPARVLAG